MDEIRLTGIRGHGHHGVLDFERRDGQEFIVDLVLGVDLAPAGRSDALADTVDYSAVAAAAHSIIVGEPVDLIETVAHRIADACLGFAAVRHVEVVVHKPHAPIDVQFGDVAVRIARSR